MAEKIRENESKTDNFFIIHTGGWTIFDQNFGKSPFLSFLDIQLQFYCIIKIKAKKMINKYKLIFPVCPNF